MLHSRMKDGSNCTGFFIFVLWIYNLVLSFALLQFLLLSAVESAPNSASFSVKLNNIAINPLNGDIYVGAVNRLYQLDSNLNNKCEAKTGPQLDNPNCYNDYGGTKCFDFLKSKQFDATDTNNSNQILEVDLKHNQLISCGTVYHGSCERRNLSNITVYVEGNGLSYVNVGSNDPNSPMIGLVAPGPSGDDILYVGANTTGKSYGEYISTQCRSGIFSLSTTVRPTGAQPFVVLTTSSGERQAAELTSVVAFNTSRLHVAAFNVNRYNYFLIRSMEDRLVSKIIQVCQGDQFYDSYVETRIVCSSSEIDYSLIQAGAFVQPDSSWANDLGIAAGDYIFVGVFLSSASSSPGVCVYRLKDIRSTFTTNIRQCDRDNTMNVSNLFNPGKRCTLQARSVNDAFCGSNNPSGNSPLNGTIPLLSNSSLNLNLAGVNVTAISSMAVNNFTVLFLGTSEGRLLKFVRVGNNGLQYDSISFDDVSPVNKDLAFNNEMTHLYVMTSMKLYKVPLYECNKFLTCTDCLSAKDPFCGWCTLEGRCTAKLECQSSSIPQRWILPASIGDTSACPSTLVASPSQAGVNVPTLVTLSFLGLPPLQNGEFYSCVFGPHGVSARADYAANQLTCTSPSDYSVSDVVGNRSVQLSVQISSLNISFIGTPFMIYNCSSYAVCSQCVRTMWGCHWCINTGQCQHSTTTCTRVNTNSAEQCPSVSPDGKEILIPSGSQQELLVQVANLQRLQDAGASSFQCRMNFTSPESFPASVYNNTFLQCKTSSHQFLGKLIFLRLEILWGSSSYPVEGSYAVTVFNCSLMSDSDCSVCQSMQYSDLSKYGCFWCGSMCRTRFSANSCTATETTCPTAIINGIYPGRVPVDGGSPVTINGTNLGDRFAKVKVDVNGIEVRGVESEYETSKRYVFITNSVSQPGQAVVKVTMNNNVSQSVSTNISFTNPELIAMTPLKGPMAGGTMVTISGKDLDSGSSITVLLGSTPCLFKSFDSTRIICQTTPTRAVEEVTTTTGSPVSSALVSGSTVVRFDNATRILSQMFSFTDDPVIDSITPDGSFQSGGCNITVTGRNLDVASSNVVSILGVPATIVSRSSTQLVFISPMFNSGLKTLTLVTAEMKLDAATLNFNFTIQPDPYVNKTSSDEKYGPGSILSLKGAGLNTPCVVQLINVKVGNQRCLITSKEYSYSTLYCTVPDMYPEESPEVTVIIGPNLEFRLGTLNFFRTSWAWAIAVGVIGGASLIIIIIIVAVFVVKRVESKRRIKKLSQQLEILEKNVRLECRTAFLALQTEVLDFNADLDVIGVPFWDFKMYAFKLLFPTAGNHPILYPNRNSKNSFGGFDEQMHQFNQLLSSKYFILTFIQVLDKQQKAFGIHDRTKVASLLSVILLNRMEFATDIVKDLLEDLINRSVERKNPKLMLRSTETLVEKLLANWLSLSMYEYLRNNSEGNSPGKTLFMLFKALKHQTEKGPVDAVTAEARNTLSEDRLLREKVEPTTYTMKVHEDYNCIPCKMLSCDTVSQAKEKALDAVHRNKPYTSRPSVADINLGWGTGVDTVRLLADDDASTRVDHGWKQINTLEHFRIQDGASLVILRKTQQEDTIEKVDEYLSQNFGYSLSTPTDNNKIWHLVKHEDSHSAKGSRVISEIFLTRLLTTKMIIEPYVSDLFTSIFKVDHSLPPVVKYLFDFLDEAARKRGITDGDVVHSWKSNSLLLRFWVNVITNPIFVFDVCKSDVVSSCLSVVAQVFMDSCSTQEPNIGQDSPSTRLLFAKDIPKYRILAKQFFANVQKLPSVSDADMDAKMMEMSTRNRTDFNLEVALRDLYFYADKFQYELMVALGSNASCKRMHLLEKFEDVLKVSKGEEE